MATSQQRAMEVPVEPGKVDGVRSQFLLHGDEGLAHRLQTEEFGAKYNFNRSERQNARQDVPLAKNVHSEEEERLQREQFERLERENRRSAEDAAYAEQLEKEEQIRNRVENIDEEDIRLAQELQHQELRQKEMTEDDERIAMQMQRAELETRRSERLQRELQDQSIAQRLQERERRLAQLVEMEHELRREQSTLPPVRQPPSANNAASEEAQLHSTEVPQRERLHRSDEFADDVFDIDREEQIYMQDRQIARILQELEVDQARATRRGREDQLYDVVSSDARLARLMQEQERLNQLMRAEARRNRRAQREYHEQRSLPSGALSRSESARPTVTSPPPYERIWESGESCPRHGPCHHTGEESSRRRAVAHRSHSSAEAALPRDFLRLDPDPSRTTHNHVNDVGRPQGEAAGPGPIYIGPQNRSATMPEQITQNALREGENQQRQRKAVNRSTSKTGNCKQQ